ncbi:hypothetical protein OQA88_300 [Cercophora sp. LCS_1]
MPTTIHPSTHPPSSWTQIRSRQSHTLAQSPSHLLATLTTPDGSTPPQSPPRIVQSSLSSTLSRASTTYIYPARNALVHAILESYNEHLNLVLRPDDVWLAIVSQLSVYINTHSDQLRDVLVSHTGQKPLHIEIELAGLDHGKMAYEMGKLLDAHLSTDGLRDWILPTFSTTEKCDQVVASVLMMGAMQKYFTYSWGTRCGIPAVTLLGEQEDWVELARKSTRLADGVFGKEVARWYRDCLRPIMAGLLDSLYEPEAEEAKRFWQGVVDRHTPNGSGSVTYSGWVMGFCYWDEAGRCLHDGRKAELSRGQIPMGFVKVPVTLLDRGVEIRTEMLAGGVGMRVTKGMGEDGEGETEGAEVAEYRPRFEGFDTLRPENGWFMYLV